MSDFLIDYCHLTKIENYSEWKGKYSFLKNTQNSTVHWIFYFYLNYLASQI